MFSLVSPDQAVFWSLVVPVFGLLGIMLADKSPNIREAVTLITGLITFYLTLTIFMAVGDGAEPGFQFIEILRGAPDSPALALSFKVEPLGAMFGVIASGLWIVNSLYSIGYMRGTSEKHQTRFYMCFAVAIMSALGIAYASNLLTFFVFYEVLTLSTFPLVTHKENDAARKGGTVYLGILLGTSIGLLLPAIIGTWVISDTMEFTLGGVLAQDLEASSPIVLILLLLYAFGIGKAALMPIHPWLPNAMVAPTPVSAFLHAVAVVKAGVFGILKISVYVFGIDFLSASGANELIMWIAAGSILLASMIAMAQDNLKARLAYSTVSQLSYVTLGAMLATQMGVVGGITQIAAHALGKMTLFMCAGAIYVAHHKSLISEMRGLARRMPYTFTAFLIGACSIIGLPPMAGAWPKLFLLWGAADAGQQIIFGVLILSSLMNIVYLLTPIIRGFMDPLPADAGKGVAEAPLFCVIPAWITAIGCVVLFFFMEPLVLFMEPIIGRIVAGG
jgi:multicomponent Na+:H+ antiporter subunit D